MHLTKEQWAAQTCRDPIPRSVKLKRVLLRMFGARIGKKVASPHYMVMFLEGVRTPTYRAKCKIGGRYELTCRQDI